MQHMANSPSGDSLLARTDRILAAFGRDRPRLSAAEVARAAELPPATAQRLCGELAALGWLHREPGGAYGIGTRLWELSTRSARETSLVSAATPFLQDVQAALRQHVQLGRAEGDEVLFLQRISQPGARSISSAVGTRLPLHLSSSGLILLAQRPEADWADYARRILGRGDRLPQGVARGLISVLSAARSSGHVIQTGNLEPDRTGISVPVHGADGTVIAALGAVTDREEAPVDAGAVVRALHTAAHGIARVLQERGASPVQ